MGYSRAFRYAVSVAAIAGLTGCNDRPKLWRESDIIDIAQDHGDQRAYTEDHYLTQDDKMQLEERIEELEHQNARLIDLLQSVADSNNALRDQVNSNADKYNSHLGEYASHTHR